MENCLKRSEKTNIHHENKHPSLEYEKGDTVIVKITRNEKKSKGKEIHLLRDRKKFFSNQGMD